MYMDDIKFFEKKKKKILETLIRNVEIYHIYPTPPLGQDMTQGQFF